MAAAIEVVDAFRVSYPVHAPWSTSIESSFFRTREASGEFVVRLLERSASTTSPFDGKRLKKYDVQVTEAQLLQIKGRLYDLGRPVELLQSPVSPQDGSLNDDD
jgi:hypothetical protein